jgi:hypothetical protein
MWKEEVGAYFITEQLLRNLAAETEKTYERTHSAQTFYRLRSEPGISRLRSSSVGYSAATFKKDIARQDE